MFRKETISNLIRVKRPEHATLMGVCLVVMQNLLKTTTLSTYKLCDNLYLCFVMDIMGIKSYSNVCNYKLLLEYSFKHSKAILVIICHNYVLYEWGALSDVPLDPYEFTHNPLINYSGIL